MKIRTQFIITMAVFGAVLVLISASVVSTNQMTAQINEQQELALDIERAASELGYLSNDYLLYRESQLRARWESKFMSLSNDVADLKPESPEQQAVVNNIKGNQQRLRAVFNDVVAALEGASRAHEAAAIQSVVQVSWSRMAVQNQGIFFDSLRLSQMLRDHRDALRQANNMQILALIGIFGAFLVANYLLVYRRTLKSISVLEAGTKVIGSGDLEHQIEENDVDNGDEVAETPES